MKILTISGKAEAGKDSSALIIKEKLEEKGKKVLILHYADYLKYIASQYFGWDGKKDEKGRSILQYIGTDIVRKKDPSFWVDTAIRFITMFEDQYDYFIIPDTRFRNEIETLMNKGFSVISIYVERIDFENSLTEEQRNHPSETALDNYLFDFYLTTHSGIENLKKRVDNFLYWMGVEHG